MQISVHFLFAVCLSAFLFDFFWIVLNTYEDIYLDIEVLQYLFRNEMRNKNERKKKIEYKKIVFCCFSVCRTCVKCCSSYVKTLRHCCCCYLLCALCCVLCAVCSVVLCNFSIWIRKNRQTLAKQQTTPASLAFSFGHNNCQYSGKIF